MGTTLWAELEPPETSGFAPHVAGAAAALLWESTEHDDIDSFLVEALPVVSQALRASHVAFVVAEAGRWQVRHQFGSSGALPVEFLGEVLDRQTVGQSHTDGGCWLAAPLGQRAAVCEVLLLFVADSMLAKSDDGCEQLAALAPVVARSLRAVRHRQQERQRVERMQAVLEISSKWNQTREMEPLLVQMAEAACDLLRADRASIFLWDKSTHTLVGRPALGVENGELRIPDNVGVVGHVLQTGETRRAIDERDRGEIDHEVGDKLGYQTRNLICVPLNGRNGERFGAFEVLNKHEGNFTFEDEEALTELAAHAATALENTQERTSLVDMRRQITEQAAGEIRLIGKSAAIEALRSTISRVAGTELAVLILGENGSGKEVVAQSIHYLSQRRDKPFIAVNCAAITETLLESELFGHEKGAFTDARESRPGKFELAAGGSLFLDEIGDMSLSGQSKLLRVLEEKIVVRVGGSTNIHTDTRVIAATNQDLAKMVREKKFREDLFFRLNVVTIELPPLRDRGDDIVLLAEHFLGDFCHKAGRKTLKFAADARRRMISHGWPGNVRELRNLMERVAYLGQGDRIEVDDLAFISSRDGGEGGFDVDLPLSDATDRFQTQYIAKAIERTGGNVSEAAKVLGLHRSNLYRKMRQLSMDPQGNG